MPPGEASGNGTVFCGCCDNAKIEVFNYQRLEELSSNTYLHTNALASPIHPMLIFIRFVGISLYKTLSLLQRSNPVG
ncbi:hypothetical protein H9R40_07510 [Enterobacter kobei]|uniref:Uncharacterized protein n=1 Tax=Enterobacter kobei TaxID=208224 RepID=A0AAW3XEY9_9ENTR|nr:hypothetical protein [Enterobacter kobei]MBC6323085.1 hypothetical protein [Enterobacter kobei]MCU2430982.1 hypothetical protein [Enterobacter kobei]HCB1629747.1 hypothetical protein [Enterobacter kobei]HCC8327032.1 hypothetical protein [Enterobacter kobei]